MDLTLKEILDRYGPALAVVAALLLIAAVVPANVEGGSSTDVSAGAPSSGSDTTQPEVFVPQEGFNASDDGGGGAGTTSGAGGASSAGSGTTGSGTTGSGSTGASDPSSGGAAGAGASSGGGQPAAGSGGGGSEEPAAPASPGVYEPGNYPEPGPETQCRADGAMPQFSFYSPMCIPEFRGDNGGATAQGVTEDTIKIVWYNDDTDPATEAVLAGIGASDSEETVRGQIEAFLRYYNLHNETYGREIVYEEFQGTGDPQDNQVLRADAVAIAQNHEPFAVFHHSVALGAAFTEELGARGVVCICTTSAPRSLYSDFSPYAYTILPVLEEYYTMIAEYVGKRLNNKSAKWAGDPPIGQPTFNDQRKFGLVFLEGSGSDVNPRIQPAVDFFKQELAKYGAQLEIDIGYQFDVARNQQQSTNIIGQLITAGVNHVIFVGDPLYPIFLTQEASRQNYHPEWMNTGTGLIDTTFFGRTYDQNQWQHSFGMSPLWVFTNDVNQTSGWAAMDHVDPEAEKGAGANVTQSPIQAIFNGVHYAGPNLTPQNFAEGFFAAPAVGGRVTAPLVKFTRENPGAIKDFVEIWWDVDGTGNDELNNYGTGILMKANDGTRYQPSEWPNADPYAFDDDPSPIFTTDEPEIFPHDEDGHTHDESDPPCRSCG